MLDETVELPPPRPVTELNLGLLESIEQKLRHDLDMIEKTKEHVMHKVQRYSSNGRNSTSVTTEEERDLMAVEPFTRAYFHTVAKELQRRREYAEMRERRRLEKEQHEERERIARSEREQERAYDYAREWLADQWPWAHYNPPLASSIVEKWLAHCKDHGLASDLLKRVAVLVYPGDRTDLVHIYPLRSTPEGQVILFPGTSLHQPEVAEEEWGRLLAMEVHSSQ